MRYFFCALLLLLSGCTTLVEPKPTQRELGDFELSLGSAPMRSMAQGLVRTQAAGDMHGGLDVSHTSGWYFGQWAADLTPTEGEAFKLDSYTGFKQPLGDTFGYEVGTLVHSYPSYSELNVQEYYAGLSIFGNRLGASFSLKPDRQDHTLLANVDTLDTLGFGVTLKYGNHALSEPVILDNGGYVRSFNDWSVNLSRPWLGINFNVSYSDSDMTPVQCTVYSGINAYCDALVQFKATRSL